MLKPKKSKDAAPPEGAEGEEPVEGGKKKPPMMLILIAVGVLVLLLGGGGAVFFLMQPAKPGAAGKAAEKPKEEAGKDKEKDKEKDKDKDKKGKGSEAAIGVVRPGPNGSSYFTLPDLVVNMQVPDGRPTFLKLKLTFEIADAETLELVQQSSPRLQDMFTGFLRELRPEDLSGSQGVYQLKAEILRRVNLVLAPRKVDAVLIEEMLVQ